MKNLQSLRTETRIIFLALALVYPGCAGTLSSSPGQRDSVETKTGVKTERMGEMASFENNYRVGISTLEEGNLEEARAIMELLKRKEPENLEVKNALGVLYRQLGENEQAVSEYRAALAALENNKEEGKRAEFASRLQNNLGIALRGKGDFKGAEKSYQEAIRLNPRFPDPYYNLGVLYDLYLGRVPDALTYYKKFLSISGKDKEVELWVKDLEQRQKRQGKQ